MRLWNLAPFALCALFLSPAAEAGVYKCSDASGATVFQATPCNNEAGAREYKLNAAAATPIQGYNWACTHYYGRKVLTLQEVSKLTGRESEDYLEWLYSDDAPSKEEKDACLARQKP